MDTLIWINPVKCRLSFSKSLPAMCGVQSAAGRVGIPSQTRAGQMPTLGPKSHLFRGRAPIARHQDFYGARLLGCAV